VVRGCKALTTKDTKVHEGKVIEEFAGNGDLENEKPTHLTV
jgi:hypothetical protein